jgi:predicted transcriptional regulator
MGGAVKRSMDEFERHLLDRVVGVNIIVTCYGTVRVSESTARWLDQLAPGWNMPRMKGRKRAVRAYNARAERGKELIEQAALAISELAWWAGQELESI